MKRPAAFVAGPESDSEPEVLTIPPQSRFQCLWCKIWSDQQDPVSDQRDIECKWANRVSLVSVGDICWYCNHVRHNVGMRRTALPMADERQRQFMQCRNQYIVTLRRIREIDEWKGKVEIHEVAEDERR